MYSATINELSLPGEQPQANATKMPGVVAHSLFWMVATSSVVMFEPAPCDLAFVVFFPFLFLTGHIILVRPIHPLIAFGGSMFMLMNLISIVPSFEWPVALRYLLITIYLGVFFIVIVGLFARYGPQAYETVKMAFIVAGLVTAIVGILARFRAIPNWEMFMLTDAGFRIKSTFKDANVLGPFLIAASVLILTDMILRRKIKLWEVVCLSIYAVAILLTFSRGAYLAGVVSFSCLLLLFWWVPQYRAATNRILFLLVPTGLAVSAVIVAVLISTGLGEFFVERFSYQKYDDERFLNQQEILHTVGRVPVGVGPGSWNKDNHLYIHDVHSLFLRTWVEHGSVGFIGLLLFLFGWCQAIWAKIAQCGKYVHIYIACGAIFWGVISNSASIDTVHWRHFFLFMAIPVGLIVYEKNYASRDELLPE